MTQKEKDHVLKDRLFLLLLLFLAIYVIFWVGLTLNKYFSFGVAWFDLGLETYSFFIHVGSYSATSGLQFVSFANHIDPFEVLLLPAFVLYQNPITLLVLQDVFLAATSIVIYLIGKNIVKNKQIGFALAIAFLINPGVIGITLYDFHSEAFIPFFYLLCFYFYFRGRMKLFVLSYVFLVSVMETTVAVAMSLLLGLLVYELFESGSKNKNWQESRRRFSFIGICFAIGIVFSLFYSLTVSQLISGYANGNYQSLPQDLKVMNFMQYQINSILTLGNRNLTGVALASFLILSITGIIILVFGFGYYTLKVPITTFVLLAPWLFEVFILHNVVFPALNNEYYAYAIGGAVVAACLGIMKGKSSEEKTGWREKDRNKITVIMAAALSICFWGMLFTPQLFELGNPLNWFAPNETMMNLNSAVQLLNANSTIMTQPKIATHMYEFRNLEMPPDFQEYGFNVGGFTPTSMVLYWFRPDYIIMDENLSDYYFMNNSVFNIYQYMDNNYTFYRAFGGVVIYRID